MERHLSSLLILRKISKTKVLIQAKSTAQAKSQRAILAVAEIFCFYLKLKLYSNVRFFILTKHYKSSRQKPCCKRDQEDHQDTPLI
jgi:hypothetical protein